jgi:hypothetical protein
MQILNECVAVTGYARKYAIQLLNHPGEVKPLSQHFHFPHYGPEVQQALVAAWNAANRICAKRLMPFLPTLLDSLVRHGHLQLSQEHRAQLLAMSAATADRFLRSHRTVQQHGLSTTKAGTLLKSQIPIRTFEDWNETRPGFVEADLVAHCGMSPEGGFLYTLTLTDVATGWTECLPLLNRSRETVLAGFQRARTLFPFPLLGVDTDNGSEFINEELVAYCEQEHLTFTRGRPYRKPDQCFVEQKNGTVVRQVVGYDCFSGEQAYRQLTELYRALRLYVNCFQPSMKLVSKQRDGKKVRCVYDEAKTPLQRLLLSGALPSDKQSTLTEVAQALDPVGLFQQIQHLQQAVFRHAVSHSSLFPSPSPAPLLFFSAEGCMTKRSSAEKPPPDPASVLQMLRREQQKRRRSLDWRRTRVDPFEGVWGHVTAWLRANPERTSKSIFQSLDRLFLGRFQPSQIPTLRRGMRKIRVSLLETFDDQWQEEVIHGPSPEKMVNTVSIGRST